jgi:hypothetical protein
MLKDLIARVESNPNLESSILRALEGIAFEFATAGTDAGRLGAFQEELGANLSRLVKAIINVPVREPKATPIEQTPLACLRPVDMLPAKLRDDEEDPPLGTGYIRKSG